MNDAFFQEVLDSMFDGVYFVDPRRRITYWNQGAERISGFSEAEVMGRSCADNILRHVDEEGHQLCLEGCPLAATMSDGQPREAEVYMHHKDGHRVPVVVRAAPIRDEAEQIIGAVEVFVPGRTAERAQQIIEDLRRQALHDPLTQIGNRRFGETNLESLEGDTAPAQSGILFVDIDHFKHVNDTYGHEAGDEVLKMVANTLLNGLRAGDSVCRWGGEEFVVMLPGCDGEDLARVAERLRMLVAKSWIDHEGNRLRVTISLGGALTTEENAIERVLEQADRRLYVSKETGRNRVTLTD
ncbi:MAG: GGDEF domain-containing protein [Actinobacteria bacterium]|nr:GGDEF domain-containing protein [Actinomycetota bacterium]